MKDLTLQQRSLLCALLQHYMISMGASLKHPEVTEQGRARYLADIEEAAELIGTLTEWRAAA